jgi:hypothetical protein
MSILARKTTIFWLYTGNVCCTEVSGDTQIVVMEIHNKGIRSVHMYDHADSDIRWTNMKCSHFAYMFHCWQLLPSPCLQSMKIFVHTLDILDMNLRHLIGLVEIISSECTILFCRTNLALFINILFGWKVASTIWAVYAIVYYYSVLILKQRYLTYKHDVCIAIQSGVCFCTNVRNIRRETGNTFLSHPLSGLIIKPTAVPSWSCSQDVCKPVWHIPLLCVQW